MLRLNSFALCFALLCISCKATQPVRPSYLDACKRVVQSVCESDKKCGGTYAEVNCDERATQTCDSTPAAVTAGSFQVDDAKVTRCLDALRAATCTSVRALEDCDFTRLAVPKAVENEVCENGACAPGFYCDPQGMCPAKCLRSAKVGQMAPNNGCVTDAVWVNGTCQKLPTQGEACIGRRCAPDFFCDATLTCVANPAALPVENEKCFDTACARGTVCNSVDDVCLKRRTVNETCGGRTFCQRGLFCGATGTCQVELKLGEVCTPQQQCNPGLLCTGNDASPGRCQKAASQPVGATCQAQFECQFDSFCNAEKNQMGTCEARRLEGAACVSGDMCVTGLQCSAPTSAAGVCQKRGAVGESCDLLGALCKSELNCIGASGTTKGVCQEKKKQGEPCDMSSECKALCNNKVCLGC